MRRQRHRVRPRGLLAHLFHKLIGRGERMIRLGDRLPIFVALYPRGRSDYADSLERAFRERLPSIPAEIRGVYDEALSRLPSIVVVDLRRRNLCTCLGHHHPESNYGGVTRRLAEDTHAPIGEIDLAVEAIREWRPMPIAALAADETGTEEEFLALRFETALLSVALHELDHLAFPDKSEGEIRSRSDTFHRAALQALLPKEFGVSFGISSEVVQKT